MDAGSDGINAFHDVLENDESLEWMIRIEQPMRDEYHPPNKIAAFQHPEFLKLHLRHEMDKEIHKMLHLVADIASFCLMAGVHAFG